MHDEICRRRLAGQFLTTVGPETGAEVVRALGAVQAQDYAGAKWAVAQRTTGRTDAEIEREVEAGRILRTHVLRPTWHFVVPADIRWMLELTGPRVQRIMAGYDRRLGIGADVLTRATTLVERALSDNGCLTRRELGAHLRRAGIP